jgi:hypothetical protein
LRKAWLVGSAVLFIAGVIIWACSYWYVGYISASAENRFRVEVDVCWGAWAISLNTAWTTTSGCHGGIGRITDLIPFKPNWKHAGFDLFVNRGDGFMLFVPFWFSTAVSAAAVALAWRARRRKRPGGFAIETPAAGNQRPTEPGSAAKLSA